MCPASNLRHKSPTVLGSGIRRAPRASIYRLVAPQELKVLKSRAARQGHVCDVQDVIRLVTTQADLEKAEAIVDLAIEPQPFHQQIHRSDPA